MLIYPDRLSITPCDYKYYITYGNALKKYKAIELKEKCTPVWGVLTKRRWSKKPI